MDLSDAQDVICLTPTDKVEVCKQLKQIEENKSGRQSKYVRYSAMHQFDNYRMKKNI